MQFIGIDAAKATFDIALPLSHGKYRTKAKLPNTPKGFDELLAWRAKHAPNAAVGMEATGIYHDALAQALVEAGVVGSCGQSRPSKGVWAGGGDADQD